MTQAQGAEAQVSDARLRALVRSSPLPANLLRLADGRILETSDAFVELTGMTRADVLGMTSLDYAADPAAALASLTLVASGSLDSYSRRGTLRRGDGDVADLDVRITACAEAPPRLHAVATVLPPQPVAGRLPMMDESREAASVVLGTVDRHWRVDRITSTRDSVLAYPPAELLGRSAFIVVHPEDVGAVLTLALHAHELLGGAFGRIRFRTRDGGWAARQVGLQPLAGQKGSGGFAFSVWHEAPDGEGVQHQRPRPPADPAPSWDSVVETGARHVEASALATWMASFPSALAVPELGTLTAREYEIVLRLASGERVRVIARNLHLSESTVRNHLTGVFRKFGVRSQSDLLARLRPDH